ncbi:tyrosine--tRNA ligase [Candidatus Woesearchaeota archaeon]|nr:tyrosine--tRNA ligase [Candidatus Woesearchaeota archaeon]
MLPEETMNEQERFDLIARNTEEIIQDEELIALLRKKQPVVYLGTAITGRPHVGYFVWVLKLADFLQAGFKVKLLLADLHGALDGTAWDVLDHRFQYYAHIIPLMFEAVGADINNVELVRGSDFQLQKKYFFDLLKLSTLTSVHDATKAASEVVKMGSSPKMAGILYPLMQTLDEEYLDVDVQYGGIDQRKILVYAREFLPKLGYRNRVEVMTPLIPGLIGKKMSASDPRSKIDLLDDEETTNKKIKDAYCEAGIIEDNGLLAFLKYVIMTIKQDNNNAFIVERPEKFGGNLTYNTYEELEKDFVEKKLHPLDLKTAVAREINNLLRPFRREQKKLQELSTTAYS